MANIFRRKINPAPLSGRSDFSSGHLRFLSGVDTYSVIGGGANPVQASLLSSNLWRRGEEASKVKYVQTAHNLVIL